MFYRCWNLICHLWYGFDQIRLSFEYIRLRNYDKICCMKLVLWTPTTEQCKFGSFELRYPKFPSFFWNFNWSKPKHLTIIISLGLMLLRMEIYLQKIANLCLKTWKFIVPWATYVGWSISITGTWTCLVVSSCFISTAFDVIISVFICTSIWMVLRWNTTQMDREQKWIGKFIAWNEIQKNMNSTHSIRSIFRLR